MRAAARISGLLIEFCGGHRSDGLSHSTVQNYLLRVGLDQLSHGIEPCSDRVWIIDHMIAAGSLKCLVVLGISAKAFAQLDRPLEHHDVEVLALVPIEVSNGLVVKDQLSKLAKQHGVPRAILTDRGSDLKKGTELFLQDHPATILMHDIAHLTCRLIWKRLEKESRFSEYRQACCQCANKVRQSSLAHLKPPRPKTKARYMNLDPEIQWGQRALWLLDRVRSDHLTDRQRKRLPPVDVEACLGWLDEYRDELTQWKNMMTIGQSCCGVVRRCGYSSATVGELRSTVGTGTTAEAKELIAELLSTIEQQCTRCSGYPQKLPGSSEVIESLIGKGKRLLGTSQNNNSLTGQILSLAASTIQLSASKLREALQRCRMGHLRAWLTSNIGPGIHVARREDLTTQENGKKLAQARLATTPNF